MLAISPDGKGIMMGRTRMCCWHIPIHHRIPGGDLELPFTGTITEIGAYCDTAGTTGTATIDVNLGGTTIMTTNKISIETTEKSSRDATTQPGLTTTAVTAGNILTCDIDAIQTTAGKGLTIRLGIRQT